MKVYIVTGEPFPNAMAATARIKCYAKAIIEQGVECEVLIYRRTEKYGLVPKNIEGKGVVEGISFYYIGGTPLRGSNVVIRQLNDRLDKWNTIRYLSRELCHGDVVLGYMGNEYILVNYIIQTAHKKGAVYVRDLCELPYGYSKETPSAIKGRKKILFKQFPLLDGVIPISDTLLELAKQYTHPNCKFQKIPIMVDFANYEMNDRSQEAEIPYIFHSGTLYEQKDGILGMIEAFGIAVSKIKKPIKFVFTGNLDGSPHKEDIYCLIKQYNLQDRLVFTGYLQDVELRNYLGKASLVIINKYKTQQNKYCFSTKLGEYLAAAKPVILTNFGEATNWLENGKSAYITEPEDTDALADAIVHVFSHPEESRKVGLAGQEVCSKCFDYRKWSKPLIKFLNSLGKQEYNGI